MSTIIASNLAGPSSTGTAATLSSLNGGPIAGNRNRIINGDMRIWQRGTTFTNVPNGTYCADRFSLSLNGINLTITQSTDVPNAQFKYSLQAVPASSATATEAVIRQWVEQQNIYDFAGQLVTTSAWVKCSKSQVKIRLGSWNATGGGDSSQTINVTANTWTKISYTHNSYSSVTAWGGTPVDSGAYVDVGFNDGATLTPSDYILITGVQVEPGTVATPFERRSYGQELALCQRYYFRLVNNTGASANILSTFQAITAGSAQGKLLDLPVPMRSTPTAAASGTWVPRLPAGTNGNVFTAYVIDLPTRFNLSTSGWTGSAGLTAGYATGISFGNTNYIEAAAEL